MNKYKKLIELIENNGLEIQSSKCYDPQSAWHGEELWIVDKKSQNKIFDLSLNGTTVGFFAIADGMGGYENGEYASKKAIEEVEKYLLLQKMDTFDDFKKWVEKNAKPQKNA